MRFRLAAVFGCILALAGCTIPARPTMSAAPASQTEILPDPVIYMYAANIYSGYLDYYHPLKLVNAIDGCYARDRDGPISGWQHIRYCMVLDYTGRKGWEYRSKSVHRPIPEHFTIAAETARFTHYGPLAHFNDPDQMFAYLRRMSFQTIKQAAIVQQDMAECIPHMKPMIRPWNCILWPYKYIMITPINDPYA